MIPTVFPIGSTVVHTNNKIGTVIGTGVVHDANVLVQTFAGDFKPQSWVLVDFDGVTTKLRGNELYDLELQPEGES